MPNRIKKHKEKTKRAETAGGLAMDIWPPKLLENHLLEIHWETFEKAEKEVHAWVRT